MSHLLALLSSIAYGAADFLGGLATKRGSAVFSVVVVSQSVGLLLVLAALPLLPPANPTRADFLWGAASGLSGGVGLALLYRGLSIGLMSVVAPVTAVCAVVVPVAVGLALGERPSVPALAGVALALLAIVLISQSGEPGIGRRATTPGARRVGATGVGIAIGSGVAIGIFLVCLERTAPAAGLWPLVAARIASVSLFALAALVTRGPMAPLRNALPIVLGGGALDMLANVLYLLAVRQGDLAIVATLTSLYPASTVLLARIVLGERLRGLQQAGVACAAVAIVLIVSS